MKIEERIAGMCLYGFIRGENPEEQDRCMHEIRSCYGPGITRIVRRQIKKSRQG